MNGLRRFSSTNKKMILNKYRHLKSALQIEELKATLECERMYREQLEMRLDESSREVATLTMLLNEGRLTLKSKVQQHLDHQNTEKTNKFI
ncbi:ank repeat-containing [Schistosoma japonicum]|nr:ank repeat-containing [Schistosoma japonicum]